MANFEIYGDCRFKYMPDYVERANYTEARIHVRIEEGAGIRGLVSMAYAHAKARPQDTVIVCPGVIDFLYIGQTTGQSSLRFNSVAEAVDHITSLINEGDVNYHTAYPHSHMIFGLLTGMDLAAYPMANEKDTFKQYVINASIISINEEIVAVNERNHLPTPWLSGKVHRIRHTRKGQILYQQLYHHLRDGFHPTSKLLEYWANKLVSTIWHCT